MKFNRTLYSVLSMTACVSMMGSLPAFSAEKTFNPVSNWSVTLVNAKTKGSVDYCTLSQRFESNTVVTVARNKKEESTIAVDFQQDLFETNETYQVSIQAGDGAMREFMVRPATRNALVFRIGTDKAFMQALEKSDVLAVIMDGARYNFALSNVSRAMNQLSMCLDQGETLNETRAELEKSKSRIQAVEGKDRELEAVRKALSDKEAELATLKSDREKLLQQMKEQAEKPQVVEPAPAPAPAQNTAEIESLTAQLKALEQQNKTLLGNLETIKVESQTAQADAIKAEQKTGIAALARVAALKKQAEADKQALEAKLAEAQTRMADLEKAAAATPAQSSGQVAGPDNSALMQEMTSQIDTLKRQNEELNAKIAQAQQAKDAGTVVGTDSAALAEAQKLIAEKEAELESAQAERDVLRSELNAQIAKGGPSAASNGSDPELRAQMDALERQVDTLKSDNQALAKRLAMSGTSADNQKILAELSSLRTELTTVTTERNSLRDQIQAQKADASGKSGEGVNRRLQSLQEENVNLIRQLEFERARLEQMEGTQKAGTSGNDVSALLAENKRLQAELATASTSSSNADTAALEAEVRTLRAQNQVLNAEMNRRLSSAPERAAADNQNALDDRKTQAEMQKIMAALEQSQRRYEIVEAENVRLSRELSSLRGARAAVSATPPVASTAQAATVVAQTQSQQQAAAPVSPVTNATPAAPSALNGADLQSLLQKAQIPMKAGFQKVGAVSSAEFAAFRWDTGVVFGTAEQQRLNNAGEFASAIDRYLKKTRDRCSGSFDQTYQGVQKSSAGDFAVSDVACIMPDGSGAGAALVFFYKNGNFNVVAHEGEMAQFNQAMATRDRVLRFLFDTN